MTVSPVRLAGLVALAALALAAGQSATPLPPNALRELAWRPLNPAASGEPAAGRRLLLASDGPGSVVADSRNPDAIYATASGGRITRLDLGRGQSRGIDLPPPAASADAPPDWFDARTVLVLSATSPDLLYAAAGSRMFRSTDRGEHWNPLDLHARGAILSMAENPRDTRVLWAGTDVGLAYVSRDSGRTWTTGATPLAAAPSAGRIVSLNASAADAGTAYVAVDRQADGDAAPHVFRTADFGRTWTPIAGLAGPVHVIAEDPREPSLLYAGTERGVFASLDAGTTWTDLRLGLAPVPTVDLTVDARGNDLVMATRGRGSFVLDDVTVLQQLATRGAASRITLFRPMPVMRDPPPPLAAAAAAPALPDRPYGALITYYLDENRPGARARVTVEDATGRVVYATDGPTSAGVHRVVWDLGEPSACDVEPDVHGTWIRALPGAYQVKLEYRFASGTGVASTTTTEPLVVRPDPQGGANPDDWNAWYRSARALERAQCTSARLAERVRSIRDQLQSLPSRRPSSAARALARAAGSALAPLVTALAERPGVDPADAFRPRMTWLEQAIGRDARRPGAAEEAWIEWSRARSEETGAQFNRFLGADLAALNAQLTAEGLAAIK